jgi:uncharacterized coiled-coil DUF342 family protein
MTTEERIDRLEALAETTLLAVQQLVTQQETLQQDIHQLARQQQADHQEMRTNIRDVVSMITTLAESADEDRAIIREMQGEIREIQGEIREMQSEVRGLQTENRRILDHLLNNEDIDP